MPSPCRHMETLYKGTSHFCEFYPKVAVQKTRYYYITFNTSSHVKYNNKGTLIISVNGNRTL